MEHTENPPYWFWHQGIVNNNIDSSVCLLYTSNADFEKYEVIDGVRVRCGNETKNWCGPINAGVTLVWKLF